MRRSWTAALLLGVTSCGLEESGQLSASASGGAAGTTTLADSSFGGTGGDTDASAAGAGSGGVAGAGGSTGGTAGSVAGAGGTAPDASLDAAVDGAAGAGADAGLDASVGRVKDGLVLLYEFGEGSGNKVKDSSGFGAAYDLTITDTSKVKWGAGFLDVESEVRIQNTTQTTKLIDECKKNNALSVEAWVTPKNTTQGSHSRVFGNSKDANNRNFTLMQMDDSWGMRLRTKSTDNNGEPFLQTSPVVTTALTHVVYTRATSGTAAIWVNAAQKASGTFGGDLSNWNSGYGSLAVNEFSDSRPWLGRLHLIAVYCRELSAAEVLQNFDAGP